MAQSTAEFPRQVEDTALEPQDKIFADEQEVCKDFTFGKETATVFDDMVSRSVPFYGEIQRMCCEISADFATAGSNVYDLGCATGTTLLSLDPLIDTGVKLIGVDNSGEMLEKARKKLEPVAQRRELELVETDLDDCRVVENASVVLLILTLQFVRPLHRERVLKRLYEGMRKGSALILVEKVTGPHTLLNRLFITYYYDYKRRKGYTDLEISQKREALENVLIPYHYLENDVLLRDTGFQQIEEFFRWYNFCGLVAVK